MPDDAYTTTGGGLKLKGGVKKPKKKKKRTKTSDAAVSALVNAVQDIDEAEGAEVNVDAITPVAATGEPRVPADQAVGGEDKPPRETYVKTEAELRHEERKRRQFNERLKKEGVKTHKERVEELNVYLSKLSEHHDMPRIGPG